jgi:hypothetical protein
MSACMHETSTSITSRKLSAFEPTRLSSDRLPTVNPQAPIEQMRGNGEVLLLVEDEEGVPELAETVLSGLGYTVVAAASGVETGQGISRAAHRSPLHGCRAAGRDDGTARRVGTGAAAAGLRVLFTSGYSKDNPRRGTEESTVS